MISFPGLMMLMSDRLTIASGCIGDRDLAVAIMVIVRLPRNRVYATIGVAHFWDDGSQWLQFAN